MKTVDYINILIKDKESLTELCKSHAETIRLMKREIGKLNSTICKKDKKIQKIENDKATLDEKLKKVKNELVIAKTNYDDLKCKYDDTMKKIDEYVCIFNEIENTCDDSD
jgi:predicted nuclease with TOPRIM domain